jgi:uncharacterized protein YdaT
LVFISKEDAAMAKKSTHVVPHDGKWAVRQSNSERASSVHDRKSDAVDRGRQISRNQGSELVIHRQNGTIQQKDSHGNDPNPPKG